ncbi:MAG: adenine deaminase [Selenomonadaceae bacterium]|nr:adenine deaminase [Selenomonadaceae bacterium]
MTKAELKHLIDAAAGRIKADLVIKNCQIVNVLSGEISSGEVAIAGGKIIGMGNVAYDGKKIFDAGGKYLCPGFIDGHIHIESSYISPEQLGRIIVPRGTTSIIADPHEIANVCGLDGIRYMLEAAKHTKLNIIQAMPSCVPATPFEDAGAVIEAADMKELLGDKNIFGLGEFMNAPGIINCDDKVLDKILLAKNMGKLIDGHAPNLTGKNLNAYLSAGVGGDHECTTVEEMHERIAKGMYVLIREGSACHNLKTLVKGVNQKNSRRVLLCSDDCQPKTILELGHMDKNVRMCVEEGLDPITAIQLATINVAESIGIYDRGIIAVGAHADLILLDDLKTFHVDKVWIGGELVAENGKYLPEIIPADISSVRGSVRVKNFSVDRLKLNLTGGKVNVIGIEPGGVVTKKILADVQHDETGDFIFNPAQDICKVAVIERHHETGKIGLGLLGGYGIQRGAIAVSVAHDSHNIIAAGVSNEEIFCAVEALIKMEGGMVLVKNGKIISLIPLLIGGLMSDLSGEELKEQLDTLHEKAHAELGISASVEPVMTLTFMSLPVIPEIKLTARGLFDYDTFNFIPIEAS